MADDDRTLDEDQVRDLLGDDVRYWIENPFMPPDLIVEKVCWWVTVANRAAHYPPVLPGKEG